MRCTLAAIGLLAAVTAAEAQKIDVVTLNDGAILQCEIKGLERGRLEVDTDAMGIVSIKWDAVRSVVSPRTFRVETSARMRLIASLGPAPDLQVMLLNPIASPVTMELATVVELEPIGDNFWKKLDGSLDLGFSYDQSTGVAQLNFSSTTAYRLPGWEFDLSASSYFTRQREEDDSARHSLQFTSIRPIKRRLRYFVIGSVESNPDLGYNVRSTGTAGIGTTFVRTNRAFSGVGVGLSYNHEDNVDGTSRDNLELLLAATASYFTYRYPKTDASISLNVLPSLNQEGRYRIDAEGKLKREIVHDFSVGFSAYDSYDSQPASSSNGRKNDLGLSLTIGWTF